MFGIETYANQYLVYLFFTIFIPIGLFIWKYHWKRAKIAAFAHIASMRKIADAVSFPKIIVKRTLVCCAYVLIVFALMRPQGNPEQELKDGSAPPQNKEIASSLSVEDMKKTDGKGQKVKIRETARDVLFLLDVSASMGAEDLYPNRLEKAKLMIRDIISVLDGEHIGLIVFTSVPSVKCVLTLDYTYFKQVLDDVKINDNDFAGTKFTPALEEVIERQFDFSDNKHKDLIVITDGGDTDLEGLEGEDKAKLENAIYDMAETAYGENDIRIHTVGLGSRSGSIVYGVKDSSGQPVRSGLNETFLKNISRRAKGLYVSVEDSYVNIQDIFQKRFAEDRKSDLEKERELELDQDKLKELVQKQKEKEEKKVVYEEFYTWPLLFAILLLGIEFFISEKRRV